MDAADVVLSAPTSELLSAYGTNPRAARYRSVLPEGVDIGEALRPYGRFDRFLVRTALVRSDRFKAGKGPVLDHPGAVARLCRHLGDMDQEFFVTIATDARHRLVAIHETAVGGVADVGPALQNVLKIPLLTGARGVILLHNHPSGDPTPSKEDLRMTELSREQAKCIGTSVLDHIIVAADGYYSLMEQQVMPW
jgi:DNA repair protein RadC